MNNIIELRNQNVPLVIAMLMAVKSYIKSFFLLFLVLLLVFLLLSQHHGYSCSCIDMKGGAIDSLHPKEAQDLGRCHFYGREKNKLA